MTKLRTILLLLCSFTMSLRTFSQNVTITPDGITPALSGSYQRLTYDAIVALPSPNDGDIAYDVTFKCMRLYNGTKWVRLVSDDDLNLPSTTAWSGGSPQEDAGHAIATDSSGNVFITGHFSGTATFGDTSAISSGYWDIFVAKYNNTGSLQWVQTAGGANNDVSNCIAIDKNGDVVIAGYFYISCTFDSTTLTSAGKADIFIAKYSNNGTLIWVDNEGGTEIDAASSIALDSTDNIYITGYYSASATFGTRTIPNAGRPDVFFAKYNTNGTLQELVWLGSSGSEAGKGITVDKTGAIYVTGYYGSSTISFDNFTLTQMGTYDIFIAKYDPVLNGWAWATNAGGTADDRGNGIAVDNNGSLYVTGFFGDTSTFGSTSSLTSMGNGDTFIAKYDTNGNLIWAKNSGSINDESGNSVSVDSDRNIYITGYFNDTASFDNISVTSAGDIDIYIAKYNSAGVIQWVQRYGGVYGDKGIGITVDNANNIYMTGAFQLSAKFGSKNLTSAGQTDIFVTRIKE